MTRSNQRNLTKSKEDCKAKYSATPLPEEIKLLTIKKVTPKEKSANVRVTQVHGSLEGKDVLALATKI